MCWSATASLTMGCAGVATAAYAYKNNESNGYIIPLLYLSLMEFLQFVSYFYINQCALNGQLNANSVLTLLSYIHIAFQPVFFNMLYIYSLEEAGQKISRNIRKYVYISTIFIGAILIFKIIPTYSNELCSLGQTLCGEKLCTISGNWHIAWSVPQYAYPIIGDAMIYFGIGVFIIPLFYGAWPEALLVFISGPILSYFLTSGNQLEWPAVWCLYSTLIIGIMLLSKILEIKYGIPPLSKRLQISLKWIKKYF